MLDNNTEKNLMLGFSQLKNYTVILNEELRIVNINKMI